MGKEKRRNLIEDDQGKKNYQRVEFTISGIEEKVYYCTQLTKEFHYKKFRYTTVCTIKTRIYCVKGLLYPRIRKQKRQGRTRDRDFIA